MKRSDPTATQNVNAAAEYGLFKQAGPSPQATLPPAAPVAVLVVHGMGQQLPLQTLDQVKEGLVGATKRAGGTAADPQVAAAAVGAEFLRRVELTLTNSAGKQTDVHIYEAYWAPITEGQIGIKDVMRFLRAAGRNGLRNTRDVFQRWVLGAYVDFGRFPRTAVYLQAAYWTVLSLIVLNSIIILVGGTSAILGADRIRPSLLGDLTGVLLIGTGGIILLALAMWAHRHLLWLVPICFFPVLTTLGLIFVLAYHRLTGAGLGFIPVPAESLWYWAMLGFWVLLVLASKKVRDVLVEYVGDVAIYVAPHLLDRFSELRKRIRQCVYDTAEQIYGMHTPGTTTLTYSNIALVGHSLGSVATYDVINTLIARDNARGTPLKVQARTALLLTFGSPLDKIAFVFAAQGTRTTETRERLAATTQPLIQDYKYRTFPWINIYSDQDVVSGDLTFYDNLNDEKAKEQIDKRYSERRCVENERDTKAQTPLLAHLQYWKNEILFDKLHTMITR